MFILCALRLKLHHPFSWPSWVPHSLPLHFALHHLHYHLPHFPAGTGLELVFTLKAQLAGLRDCLVRWLPTHQPQVMSPNRLSQSPGLMSAVNAKRSTFVHDEKFSTLRMIKNSQCPRTRNMFLKKQLAADIQLQVRCQR